MTSPVNLPPRLSGSEIRSANGPLAVAERPVELAGPTPAPTRRIVARGEARWAPAWRAALSAFLLSRFVVLLGGWAGAMQLVRMEPARHGGLLVESAMLWDGTWYWRVMKQGYFLGDANTAPDLAFCPFFPLVLHGVTGLLDGLGIHAGDPVYGNFVLAGLLVSNGSFLLALVLLWRLIRQDNTAAVADRTLLLLGIFPTALFWSVIYTESLFFLMVVGVFWLARREQWLAAAALAGLAGITRWQGILLGAVILVEYLWRWGVLAPGGRGRLRAALRPDLLWLAVVPLPLLSFLRYLGSTFGDPLIFIKVEQQGWGHGLAFFPQVWLDGVGMLIQSWQNVPPAFDAVLNWGGGQRLYLYQDLGLSALFAGLAVWAAWRRALRPSDLLWLALGVIFPLSLGTTMGLARYLLQLWPGFLLLARLMAGRPRLERGWLIASSALLAVTTYLWASAHWID
jgi:hypothetical protein